MKKTHLDIESPTVRDRTLGSQRDSYGITEVDCPVLSLVKKQPQRSPSAARFSGLPKVKLPVCCP